MVNSVCFYDTRQKKTSVTLTLLDFSRIKDILLNHSSMKDFLLNYKLCRNKYNSILSQLWLTKFLSLDIIQLTELQGLILHLKEKDLRIRGHEEVYLPWIFVGSDFAASAQI